jgi:hypothetical protein
MLGESEARPPFHHNTATWSRSLTGVPSSPAKHFTSYIQRVHHRSRPISSPQQHQQPQAHLVAHHSTAPIDNIVTQIVPTSTRTSLLHITTMLSSGRRLGTTAPRPPTLPMSTRAMQLIILILIFILLLVVAYVIRRDSMYVHSRSLLLNTSTPTWSLTSTAHSR